MLHLFAGPGSLEGHLLPGRYAEPISPRGRNRGLSACCAFPYALLDRFLDESLPKMSMHSSPRPPSINLKELEKRVRGLQIALNMYKDTGDLFASKVRIFKLPFASFFCFLFFSFLILWRVQATETEIRLLLLQRELESETGERDFVGGSLSETLFHLIATRNLKRAQKIKSDFKASSPH